MASPVLLQDKFDGGMKRDMSRDQLPKNALWDVENFLPDLGGTSLRKRGGWSYEGVALDSLDGAATVPKRVFFAGFPNLSDPRGTLSGQVLAWDNNGKLFDLTNGVDRGDTTVPLHTPILFRELVIWGDGAAAPKKYVTAGTISSLGGSPPTNARICCVWKERVLFSGSLSTVAEASKLYFSAPGNAESWDTTNAQVGTNAPIQGLAALPNALLVFHGGSVEKILGDTPPSSTNVGNLVRQSLFDSVGLYSPTSYAVQDESVYWADENGVYKTDGVSLVDLTDKGGIKTYWRSQVASADEIAVGVWRSYVWVSLTISDLELVFLLCDYEKKSWWRFTNIVALNFAVRYGATDELYFSNRDPTSKRVGKLSSVFSPGSGVKNDADTVPVLPLMTTGYFRTQGQGQKRFRHAYIGYDLRDAASDNPTLSPGYATTPESESYSSTSPSTLSETTAYVRRRVRLAKPSSGASIRIAQDAASSDTRIYAIEADVLTREASRR